MKEQKNNYIIRIYRRDEEKPEQIQGLVEGIESETREAFHNADELLRILCGRKSGLTKDD